MPKIAVQVVVYATIVVFGFGLFVLGEDPQPAWLRFAGLAVALSLLLLEIFERFLWKWGAVQKIGRVPRDVGGTWMGTLTSHWVDPSKNERIPPKPAILVVRQTASSLSVSMFTDESPSKSSLGRVTVGDEAELVYMYLNKPDMSVEHRSRMHHGSTSLRISGEPASKLKGRYWTDRDSKGELQFGRRVKSKTVNDYEDGLALFQEQASESP